MAETMPFSSFQFNYTGRVKTILFSGREWVNFASEALFAKLTVHIVHICTIEELVKLMEPKISFGRHYEGDVNSF